MFYSGSANNKRVANDTSDDTTGDTSDQRTSQTFWWLLGIIRSVLVSIKKCTFNNRQSSFAIASSALWRFSAREDFGRERAFSAELRPPLHKRRSEDIGKHSVNYQRKLSVVLDRDFPQCAWEMLSACWNSRAHSSRTFLFTFSFHFLISIFIATFYETLPKVSPPDESGSFHSEDFQKPNLCTNVWDIMSGRRPESQCLEHSNGSVGDCLGNWIPRKFLKLKT